MESNKQAEYDRKDHERLQQAISKVEKFVQLYSNILIIQCNHVSSFLLQKIRKLLRGEAEILRGKVTHLRTAIRRQLPAHPELKSLLHHIKGEIGLAFTNMDVIYIKNKIEAEIITTAAGLGTRANNDIFVPEGETVEPTVTCYFSVLNIPSKINRGKFEIIYRVRIFKKGDLIEGPGFNLLCNLKLKPIIVNARVSHVYINGAVLDEKALNEAPHLLEESLHSGIQNIASISVAIGAANKSSMMYVLKSGLRNVQALSIELQTLSNESSDPNK